MKIRAYLTTVVIVALVGLQHAFELLTGMGCSGHAWVFIIGPMLGGIRWHYAWHGCRHCSTCSHDHVHVEEENDGGE